MAPPVARSPPLRSRFAHIWYRLAHWLRAAAEPGGLFGIVVALVLVAAVTLLLAGVRHFVPLPPIAISFLIPVLIAALNWGLLSAIIVTVGGALSSAFFFYEPIHTLLVADPARRLSLAIYIIVALTSAHLATRMRRESKTVRRREAEIRALYAFSRRLATINSATDIFEAIQTHIASQVGRDVVLFEPRSAALDDAPASGGAVPEPVRAAVLNTLAGGSGAGIVAKDGQDGTWLVRAVSPKTSDFGVVAIDLGTLPSDAVAELDSHIDAVLRDAAATLEQLGVAQAIDEARMRDLSERFREALIESVSHELRTPLVSILGATSILSEVAAIKNNPRLFALANSAREEAERLNNEIQNLLDATRISGEGLAPKPEWSDPADIVNTALDRRKPRLAAHVIDVDLAPDLPLVYVDPALTERALGQLLGNAAKYSSPGSRIAVRGWREDGMCRIAVRDEGVGLSADESSRIGERFYRSPRHIQTTPGSGLGFWIARAFTAASEGRIEVESPGEHKGATVTICLPIPVGAGELENLPRD